MLMSVLKMGNKSEDELRAFGRQYEEDLSDIPADTLELAAKDLRKTAIFFPTIAEIRVAAWKHRLPRRIRISRMTELLKLPSEAKREPTEAERKLNLELINDCLERMGR